MPAFSIGTVLLYLQKIKLVKPAPLRKVVDRLTSFRTKE